MQNCLFSFSFFFLSFPRTRWHGKLWIHGLKNIITLNNTESKVPCYALIKSFKFHFNFVFIILHCVIGCIHITLLFLLVTKRLEISNFKSFNLKMVKDRLIQGPLASAPRAVDDTVEGSRRGGKPIIRFLGCWPSYPNHDICYLTVFVCFSFL